MYLGQFMNDIYLGLGSNIGLREQNIENALDLLRQHDDIHVMALSEYMDNEAVSVIEQPNYLNCAVQISTLLSPFELLDVTEQLEREMGRSNKGSGDPRVIDIDILFYNLEIVSTDRLVIPHPLAHERSFVLGPMLDIAPDYIHPLLNMSISELYGDLNDSF